MAEFLNMLVTDAIGAAYSAQISPMWEFNYRDAGRDKKLAKIRKYCPKCKTFNSLVDRDPDGEHFKERDFKKYECRCCGHQCNSPAALKSAAASPAGSRSKVKTGEELVHAMECSVIMDIVESRSDSEKNWLLWMYTDPDEIQREALEGKVLADMVAQLDEVEKQALTGLVHFSLVLKLMHAMLLDFKCGRRNGLRPAPKVALYAALIGRDRSRFKKNELWGRVMRAILNHLDQFDSDVLTDVGIKFQEQVFTNRLADDEQELLYISN